MSTTGYGDIVPRTNFERSYALAVMLIGVVVSALVFGVLAQIISEAFNDLPSSAQHQNETKIKLQEFAVGNHLNPALGRKIQRCAQVGFDLFGGVDLAATLATPEVSRGLREEVLDFAVGGKLRECTLFKGCSRSWFRALVQSLQPVVVLEGNTLFIEDEPAAFLNILISGSALLHCRDVRNAEPVEVSARAVVGDYAVLHGVRHVYTATAEKTCEVMTAEGGIILQLLHIFKVDGLCIQQKSLMQHSVIMQQLGKRCLVGAADSEASAKQQHQQQNAGQRSAQGTAKALHWFDTVIQEDDTRAPLDTFEQAGQVAMSSRCGLEAVDEVDEISSEGDVDSLMEQVAELAKVQKRLFDRFVKRAVTVAVT